MTELLGINYPAPPDTMPRLQQLRHLFAQGLDFERDTVAWLLEQAEARDALADECAELREDCEGEHAARAEVAELQATCAQLHARAYSQEDWQTGYGIGTRDEREACARLAEAHGHSDDPVDWQCSSIADAIRARGETQPPGQAGANTTAGASGAATGGLPAAQVVARFDGPWHHCKTGERRWPASRTEPCPVCGTAWGDAK